ncbi:MAG: TetR/AcrR family transcriptional regulator [Acidimicrobiia bacterium]
MRSRGRYAKGVARRDEILDRALAEFAVNGYDRTSVREIARAVGLSQAGLLHYFASKEELFVEVLRRRDARNEQRYDQNRGDPVTAEGLVSIVQHNSDEPGLVRLFVAMSAESTTSDSQARAFFAERYQSLRTGIAADVRRMQGEGSFSTDLEPDAVASILLAVADGLQVQWLLEPDSVDMGARLEALWNALRGTRASPSSNAGSSSTTHRPER